MKKFISWNNRRRNWQYWVSIEILVFVGINITWWWDINDPLIGMFISYALKTFNMSKVNLFVASILPIHLCCLAGVFLLNHLLGMLPNKPGRKIAGKIMVEVRTVCWGDIILGFVLVVVAEAGIIKLSEAFDRTSITMWIFNGLFVYGVLLYILSVVPFFQYIKATVLLVEGVKHEATAWFGLTNSALRLSTFARAPVKGKITELIVDCWDLGWINFLEKLVFGEARADIQFRYYLIVVDLDKQISEQFIAEVRHLVHIPHARILVYLKGDEQKQDRYADLLDVLLGCRNVRLRKFDEKMPAQFWNLEKCLTDEGFQMAKFVPIPHRFLEDKQMLDAYLAIGNGPKITLDFMRIIFNELDILPAIYALFDLIDLQYRLMMAVCVDATDQWMKKHGGMVGNISKMGKLLAKHGMIGDSFCGEESLPADRIFDELITEDEWSVIYKYLPNYQRDSSYPGPSVVNYLTTSLRNVLRGHGTFENVDADILFKTVFKLAIMNIGILDAGQVLLWIDESSRWEKDGRYYYGVKGRFGTQDIRMLSPFLIATETSDILVFNNFHSNNVIEYINYLDGRLILPGYLGIDGPSLS